MTHEINVPEFYPLHDGNCWEIYEKTSGPQVVGYDEGDWFRLIAATPFLADLSEAAQGTIRPPREIKNLYDSAWLIARDNILGSDELANGLLNKIDEFTPLINDNLHLRLDSLIEFFDQNTGVMRIFINREDGPSTKAVAAQIGGILLNEEIKDEKREGFTSLRVSLLYADKNGMIGSAPEGYSAGAVILHSQAVESLP